MSESEPVPAPAPAPAPAPGPSAPLSYQQVEAQVRTTFGHVYAALKAQELRTLRQLRAIRRQCETSHVHSSATTCVHLVRLSCDNEAGVLAEIERFGTLDLERLSVAGEAFAAEDYILPDEDHMYSYKCIDELTEEVKGLEFSIAEDALKRITTTENCVCSVRLTPEEVSHRFREEPEMELKPKEANSTEEKQNHPSNSTKYNESTYKLDEEKEEAVKTEEALATEEIIKINPTEDWLNCIKSQTETEPSQVTDVMEHSTIVC